MKRNEMNGKSRRYAARLENIFRCNLRTRTGQRKWARFFGWERESPFPELQSK